MNERELGAAKSAAESWINTATGRPLDGLLEGFSVRVAIYDAEGDVVFERKKGPYFVKLIAELANEASGLDEPIPYLIAEPEFREEQKGTEPVDPFAADDVEHVEMRFSGPISDPESTLLSERVVTKEEAEKIESEIAEQFPPHAPAVTRSRKKK